MYTKLCTLRTIDESGAVLIVRLPDADTAERVAHAAIEGGFRALVITLSVLGAVDLVRRLAAQYSSKGVAVGAETVLDGHAAYECIRAGATCLVSPQLNREMIRVANGYQVSTISGAFTPTELVESAEAGADILKLFPTEGAGIVLVDDSVSAVLPTRRQGRRIISGITVSTQVFLTRVATQALVIVAVTMLGLGSPYSPAQTGLTPFTVGLPTAFLIAWARASRPDRIFDRVLGLQDFLQD